MINDCLSWIICSLLEPKYPVQEAANPLAPHQNQCGVQRGMGLCLREGVCNLHLEGWAEDPEQIKTQQRQQTTALIC